MKTANLQILTQTLHGKDPLLAAEAARLIGDWGLQAMVPDLVRNLETSRFNAKVSSLYALEKLAPSESLFCEIFEAPNVPDDFYWMGFKSVKTAAAIALIKSGNPVGVEWLTRLADASDAVLLRWFAPAMLRLPRSSPVSGLLTLDLLCSKSLRDAASDPKYTDAGQLCLLCEALGLIEDPGALEHLEHYAKFHSRFVRGQAYRAINKRSPHPTTTKKIGSWASQGGTDHDLVVAAAIAGNGTELRRLAKDAPIGFDRATAMDAMPPTEEFLQDLLRGLKDKDPCARLFAVERLGLSDLPAAWDALENCSHQETRLHVQCALAAVLAAKKEATC